MHLKKITDPVKIRDVQKKLWRGITDEFEEIETSLIFETPNYKARVGIFKNFIDAAKNLEKIKRKFRGAFILKNDEL